jgi:predicted MFS family arabinose efflux permease
VTARATKAVYAVFLLSGFAFANWASRIPSIRDALELSPSSLGLVLLAIAAGSVLSMPLSGLVVRRIGTARTVGAMSLVAAAGLATVGLGHQVGMLPVVIGLFGFGAGNGTWDVAMNVEGSAVEQKLGRAIMPRFHAGFSVGTVAGALLGAAMVAVGVPVSVHLLAVAAIVALVGQVAIRGFLPDPPEDSHVEPRRSPLVAWTEPRTLLIGLFVFAAAFTEGTGNDWLAVATIDGYGVSPALGTLTFALFLAAMTLGRWFGPGLIDRHGRATIVRLFGLLALVGLALLVWSPVFPVAMAGAVLWGLGAALGFPVGMSAAGDEPEHAAARVSVVATMGYLAFLAGPPLIGFLGEYTGTLRALTLTGGLVAVGLLVSGVLRAPSRAAQSDPKKV